MNTVVHEKSGYNFGKALERARKRLDYYEEGLLIDTAARMIEAMEHRGVTRSELARRLDVSPAYISKVLRGHANLSLASLAKLAFALDLKWECILIPLDATIGVLSLTNDSGAPAIRTVETATIGEAGRSPANDEYDETAEEHYELRVPA